MADANGSGQSPAPQAHKPRLKISLTKRSSILSDATTTGAAGSAAAETGSPSQPFPRKQSKIKISSSRPSTPLEKPQQPPNPASAASTAAAAAATVSTAPASKTKAGRQPKPTQKLVDSKKRPHDDSEDDDDQNGRAPRAPAPVKRSLSISAHKIKIKPKNTPTQLVVKPRGRPPVRPSGDGYDSEASDQEKDPAIEEQFILRMLPGEHCDHVRAKLEEMKKAESGRGGAGGGGGPDIQLKFFDEETRRAAVTVRGQPFAAVMVDLPTITESMKTWDRKSLMKSADICQMLLIFAQVRTEAEARTAPLPKILEGTAGFKWPHGLTPPMHDCVNRRFAKTISRKEIEDKEAEVERLLAEDARAASTKWEWFDDREQFTNNNGDEDEEEEEEEVLEDAEGEIDYFGQQHDAEGDEDLEADLEAAFADEFMDMDTTAVAEQTPHTATGSQTPLTLTQANDQEEGAAAEEDDEDDEDEDDDDDDDDDDEDDEDDDLNDAEREARDQAQAVKSMIAQMEKQLANRTADLEKTTNKLLRTRLESQIKQLKSEIELKRGLIGLDADDD